MGYGTRQYTSRADFFAFHSGTWVRELHEVLRELLDRRRSVISIGSGECEHEIPFVLEGYDILTTDVVDSAAQTRRLFPSLRFEMFDVLNPHPIGAFDDVLMTGLDFYFSDADLSRIIANARSLLRPDGRLLFALRYRDNTATWLIDRVAIPAICALFRVAQTVGVHKQRRTLKAHGYRRTPREVIRLAASHDFRLGRVRDAGFGVELTRIYVDRVAPRVYEAARAFDRRLHCFNNVIMFEFFA